MMVYDPLTTPGKLISQNFGFCLSDNIICWYVALFGQVGSIPNSTIQDTPLCDLYCCGFPCQSHSRRGKRGGFKDGRGKVIFGVLEYIKIQQPKAFLLENVAGLNDRVRGKDKSKEKHTTQSVTQIRSLMLCLVLVRIWSKTFEGSYYRMFKEIQVRIQ